jgi:hypothetical protein
LFGNSLAFYLSSPIWTIDESGYFSVVKFHVKVKLVSFDDGNCLVSSQIIAGFLSSINWVRRRSTNSALVELDELKSFL